MASSSSSSDSRRQNRRRSIVLLRRPSRELEYEPPVRYCHHGKVAPRWTSWTDGNPGRRFFGCPYYYEAGGCKYFCWHDNEFPERAKTVIKELLDHIDILCDESKVNDGQRHALNAKFDEMMDEIRKIRRRQEVDVAEIRKLELRLKIAMALLVMTSVWIAFLYYKM